ncbi:MAG: hypothetical protein FJ291_26165 [Planctomycetes bacterium]|nr:hypothetical protein [Planctomycetota bacterium]
MGHGADRDRRAFAAIELLAVVAVIAILLGLGFSVYRGARLSARVALAENNLKQVSSALELYFRKYGAYPMQGADLAAELAPFVQNAAAFINPAVEESEPGATLSLLYREPSLAEVDKSQTYLTALPCGKDVAILRSGGRVERQEIQGAADSQAAAEAVLALLTGESQLRGSLNINPRNNDFEFDMRIGDGTTINRDDLLASRGSLFYEGRAVYIRMNPKGNSNRNTIRISGESFEVKNGVVYVIEDAQMMVRLWNIASGGGAMGRWWLDINASAPKITMLNPSGAVIGVIQK